MNTQKLFLCGLMGAGKTATGKRLAERLARPFVDLDDEVEREAGQRVVDIFERMGEPRFRELEAAALARVCESPGAAVVALGGGSVQKLESARRVADAGVVVWLRASPETLVDRLRGPASDARPLLKGLEPPARVEKLGKLLAVRGPQYDELADVVLDVDGLSPEAACDALADWLARTRAVRVDLGDRGYDVVVEAGALERLGRRLRDAGLAPGPCALVSEPTVGELYLDRVKAGLEASRYAPFASALKKGEDAKRLSEVAHLVEMWAEQRFERGTPVVALGGGSITDAAGFAAAVFLRGVPWVAVPTTLLGMVDAAIGGKTGVNLSAGKNLAGAFHQPRLVVCDPRTLATLPPDEVRSGLGEVLKYALIGPAELYTWVDDRLGALSVPGGLGAAPELAAEVVARCAAIKAGVVSRDEREVHGERKVLNFGHTLGHAIEASSDFAVLHGDAVVHGMRAAVHLSARKGLLAPDERDRMLRFLGRLPVPPIPASVLDTKVKELLFRDKKVKGGRLRFVLLRGQGRPEVDVPATVEEALEALDFARLGKAG